MGSAWINTRHTTGGERCIIQNIYSNSRKRVCGHARFSHRSDQDKKIYTRPSTRSGWIIIGDHSVHIYECPDDDDDRFYVQSADQTDKAAQRKEISKQPIGDKFRAIVCSREENVEEFARRCCGMVETAAIICEQQGGGQQFTVFAIHDQTCWSLQANVITRARVCVCVCMCAYTRYIVGYLVLHNLCYWI